MKKGRAEEEGMVEHAMETGPASYPGPRRCPSGSRGRLGLVPGSRLIIPMFQTVEGWVGAGNFSYFRLESPGEVPSST